MTETAFSASSFSRPDWTETSLMSDTLEPGVVDPILEVLERIKKMTGHSRYTVFTDWMGFMFSALEQNDPAYLDRVENYQTEYNEETVGDVMEAYASAFGELIFATDFAQNEVLGAVYERYGLTSKSFAQHFTPHNLATAMAAMLIPGEADIREATADDPLRILDPASGSGRLLVATASQLSTIAPETPTVFTAIDIDRVCAQMTAINYTLFGLPGWVIHGDALTMEVVNSWQILLGSKEEGGVIRECDLQSLPLPGTVRSKGNARTGNEMAGQISSGASDASISEPQVAESIEETADIATNQVRLSDILDRAKD